jgi:dienelactone hydrolase
MRSSRSPLRASTLMPVPTRREFLALAAVGSLLRRVVSAQTVEPRSVYRDYSRCLPDYLRDLAESAYQLRNSEIAKLTTPAAVKARQEWVTETFWKLVGGMPDRTPLNARTVGSFERPGYRLEKIAYESQPNFHVSGNLYIPTTGEPPFPGVLFQMGHSGNGKASGAYQQCCQGLARLGYMVLAFDPMGQGERTYYPTTPTSGNSRLGSDEEHTYPGRQMLLKGITSTRLQTWDSIRSLDLLAAHPLVDPKRLASTGQSGGGTTTMLLSAVDDRLAAAAVSCGITENFACANFNPPGSTDDAEQDLLGSGLVGFDRWDLLYPLAPKPLLIQVSDRDFFGTYSPNYIKSGIEEFHKLHAVYETLGHADHLAWFDTPLPHGLTYSLRLQIYNWFGRWLKGDSKPVDEEPDTSPEADKTLFVSESGSMVQTFSGETPFTLNKKRAVTKKPADLARLLGVDRPTTEASTTTLATAAYRRTRVEGVEFASAPKVWVPAWLFLPEKRDPAKPIVVVLEPGGRAAWSEAGLYNRLAEQGCVACAPDLRCVGDLTPEFGRGAARHARPHNSEEDYSWAGMILGKPLLGQRVTDLLAVLRGLRARPDLSGRKLVLAARGAMTVPAQCAAALDKSVDTLYLAGGLTSFGSIVDSEEYSHPFGNFVHRLLEHTDLPELAQSMAPMRIVLAGAVDGAGRKRPVEDVREEYKLAKNVEVLSDAVWRPEGILKSQA